MLTHNIFLPAAFCSIGFSFGAGAAAGGTVGGCFGPITFIGGLALGGVIGTVTKIFSDRAGRSYCLSFDISKIEHNFESKARAKEKTGGLSNEDARKKAKEWGFKEDRDPPFKSHGKPAFKKGRTWIIPDRDGHNGGAWNKFVGRKRVGTLDKNGKIIKS